MGTNPATHQSALTGLAVVGFIALVALGLWLAVYLVRSLPLAGGALDEAAAYIGSMFSPAPAGRLAVVPTASTTIPFPENDASSTSAAIVSTTSIATLPATTTKESPIVSAPTYYRTATTTYPTVGSTRIETTRTYSGLPDLSVTVANIGHIDSNGNYMATSSVSHLDKLAAEILVTNLGTNKTGSWVLKATVPSTASGTLSQTLTMDSLDPGQPVTVDLVLSTGHPQTGTEEITVVADPDNAVAESNENNNTDTKSITVY